MDKLTDFQNEILQAAKASFDDLKHSFSKEHFYGYCLYTDSSAMTVMPAANSEEGLQGTLKEMEVTDDSEIPEFKWAIAEWKYEAWKSNNFKLISQKLRTSQDRSDIASFAKKLQSDMVIALKKLDEDGYFGN